MVASPSPVIPPLEFCMSSHRKPALTASTTESINSTRAPWQLNTYFQCMHRVQMLPRIKIFVCLFFLFPAAVLSLLVNLGCFFFLQQRCNMFYVGAPELLITAVSAETVGGKT